MIPTMGKLLYIWIILYAVSVPWTQSSQFGEEEFNFFVDVQHLSCNGTQLCGTYQPLNRTLYKKLSPFGIPEYIDGSCCKNCSCDLETCVPSVSCCPDVLGYIPTVEETARVTKATCDYASFLKYSIPRVRPYGDPKMLYRKCPDDFKADDAYSSEVKDKCEDHYKYNTLDTQIPVTDTSKRRAYQNVFCARCYGAADGDLVSWRTQVVCNWPGDEVELLSSDIGDIVSTVRHSRGCNMVYEVPKYLNLNMSFSCQLVITECNVTGRWETYDPLIEAACHAYTSVYGSDYQNVFCALCNGVGLMGWCSDIGGNVFFPAFSMLLTTNGDTTRANDNVPNGADCPENHVYDNYKKKCRRLSCHFPKMIQQGECVNAVDVIKGAPYKFYLKMLPDTPVRANHVLETLKLLDNYTKEFLDSHGMFDMVYGYELYFKDSGDSVTMDTVTMGDEIVLPPPLPPLLFQFSPLPPPVDPQLTVTGDYSDAMYFVFFIKLYFPYGYGEPTVKTLDDILHLDGQTVVVHSNESNFTVSLNLSLEDFSVTNEQLNTLLRDANGNTTLTKVNTYYRYKSFSSRHIQDMFQPETEKPDVIAEKARCPLVKIRLDEYLIEKRMFSIYLHDVNMSINSNLVYERETTDDGIIFLVCADFYLRRLQAIVGPEAVTPEQAPVLTVQGILTLVCICLSVFCNLVTLVTYCLFKELRSQPGINNMFLVSFLTVAQCVFQFGLMWTAHISELACVALGLCIHCLWLMVMFWMNVCSFHMFRVFHSSTKVRKHAGNCRRTAIYTVYSVVASAVFVVINVVVSVLQSDSDGIGYSKVTCYISREIMVGLTFALPVGLVVLVNLVLFITVIIKVSRIPTIKSEHEVTRNYFKIYAKLSTLTGITWTFGFLFIFTGVEVLEYFFIILNASQGVFLCVAFVLNKRVLKLYQGQCCGPSIENNQSSTSSKTTSKTTVRL